MLTQIGLFGAFLGGVLSLLSPCSALLLPSFFAYAFDGVGRLVVRTLAFFIGLCVVLAPLGAGVGAFGSLLTRYRETATTVGGIVLIVLGIVIAFFPQIGLAPTQRLAARLKVASIVSVAALGAVYGLAGFCSGPLLGGVLTVAVTHGDPGYGAILMVVYALGMSAPLFVLSALWDRLRLGSRKWLRGKEFSVGRIQLHTTTLVSGAVFVIIGSLFLLTDGTANLGGGLGADDQVRIQSWLARVSTSVSNLSVLLALTLVIAAILIIRLWRNRE